MPDSKSSTRVFFRLPNELAEALDGLIPMLERETLGQVSNRSQVARHLLVEAVRERQRIQERHSEIDDALQGLLDRHAEQAS